ncbi:beta-glucuronidase-like isoform X1 [Bacillus rossius redtenbacheri]|uniref:beta-glucuronidase-like isoform X1 n=2 Tax=Bacillus rossius redtenbacheri TaxID=93214 RepID=UPI002FDEFD21
MNAERERERRRHTARDRRQMGMPVWLVLAAVCWPARGGVLYPQQSETREVKTLDGIWRFRTSPPGDQEAGFTQSWYASALDQWINMPVPASYNDVTVNASIRDYVGWVWYQREFFVPGRWKEDGLRVFLRFGSVHYNAVVWLNGAAVAEHSGGHLPFGGEVTAHLRYGAPNLLTVAVNNTLTHHTIPQGSVTHSNDTDKYPEGYVINSYSFDFFNYAGIHRPVYLYTVPQTYIDDITVVTEVSNGAGLVKYEVTHSLSDKETDGGSSRCAVQLLDGRSVVAAETRGCTGEIAVPDAKLWWPVYMHASPGHRYTLLVRLVSTANVTEDVYRLSVGIRSLRWKNGKFLINDRPVYLRGFGKHEDSDIRGKGLDLPLVTRDYNLIDWLGANSFRTSHYPYAEEIMEMADTLGIMVVDESPAVNLENFDDVLLEKHKAVMKELVQRDKNRACVVMWSLSNEASTQQQAAGPHYKEVANFTRSLDASRPIAFVTNQQYDKDQAAEFVDIIGLNRYSAWYYDTGRVELIVRQVVSDFSEWHNRFSNKFIFISEYGADAISGLHTLPSFVWTEDYQVELLQRHFQAFDKLRQEDFFIGEMIWNFADFATRQDTTRVVGNHKGVFTRQRQPKASAYTLRTRYRQLASKIDAFSWPQELHSEL